MSSPSIPSVRVRALAPARRRAGFAFTREPTDLAPDSLGNGLAAIIALAAILSDPLLSVTVVENVEGGEPAERPVTAEERDALTAFLEAESAKVDPEDPPTEDAAAKAGDNTNTEPAAAKPTGRQPAAQAKG